MKRDGERTSIPIETYASAMVQNPLRDSSYVLPESLSEGDRRSLLDILKKSEATTAIESNFIIFHEVVTNDDFRWFLQHNMLFVASQAVNWGEWRRKKEFQDILIEQSAWDVIAEVLKGGQKFGWGSLPSSIVIPMTEAGFSCEVANNLDQFAELDNEAAKALIKKNQVDSVGSNLQRFTGLDQEVADAFLELHPHLIHPIGYNLDRFRNLSSEMRQKLIQAGHNDDVQQHPEAFSD